VTENRPIGDGLNLTACQADGPTDAIVLGNVNDPTSRVSKLKASDRDYVLLIGLYFMHLRFSPSMTRLAALAGLFWLTILLTGTLDDVVTRGWLPIPGR
jgi:hypothetical protein